MAKTILLMGLDGSGKTTLANELHAQFSSRGKESVVVWAGLIPILTRPLIAIAKFLFVRKHDKFKDFHGHREARRAGMRKLAFARNAFLIILLLDYLPQVFFKVTLRRLMGKYVICDRYFHDLMLYYCVTTNAKPEQMLSLTRFAYRIFPKPDLCYFVSVPVEVALSRKADVPSLEYLNERKTYYEKLIATFDIAILDGTQPPADNCNRILTDLSHLEHTA